MSKSDKAIAFAEALLKIVGDAKDGTIDEPEVIGEAIAVPLKSLMDEPDEQEILGDIHEIGTLALLIYKRKAG